MNEKICKRLFYEDSFLHTVFDLGFFFFGCSYNLSPIIVENASIFVWIIKHPDLVFILWYTIICEMRFITQNTVSVFDLFLTYVVRYLKNNHGFSLFLPWNFSELFLYKTNQPFLLFFELCILHFGVLNPSRFKFKSCWW